MGDNDYCSDLDSSHNVTGFVYHLDKPRANMKLGLSACSGGSSADKWRLYMTNDPNQPWGNATMIEKQGLTLDADPVIDSGDTPYQYFLLFDYQSAPNVLIGIQNYGLNTVLSITGAKVIAEHGDLGNRKLTVDGGEWRIGGGAETPTHYTVRKSSSTDDPPDLAWDTIGDTGQEIISLSASNKYPTDIAQYGTFIYDLGVTTANVYWHHKTDTSVTDTHKLYTSSDGDTWVLADQGDGVKTRLFSTSDTFQYLLAVRLTTPE